MVKYDRKPEPDPNVNTVVYVFFACVLIGVVLLLVGCSTAPHDLQAIKNSVDGRIEYQRYATRDYSYIGAEGGKGNCAVFAETYRQELRRAGYHANVAKCVLRDGRGHAFAYTADGWVLDNRFANVGRVDAVGCKNNVFTLVK